MHYWYLLGLLACCLASVSGQQPVLVLVEDLSIASTHSLYFQRLSDAGYSLDIKAADDKSLRLKDWDAWSYEKLIVFASNIQDYGGAIDSESILEFVDSGHDVIIAVDSQVSEELRGVVADLGVDIEPRGTAAVDHINIVQSADAAVDHTLLASNEYGAIDGLFKTQPPEAAVLYQGTGMSVPRDSKQVLIALAGSPSTFLHPPGKPVTDHPNVAGAEAALVALVQARNNARIAVSGSIAMFSNKLWRGALQSHLSGGQLAPANRDFCTAITEWAFHERGVLRASNLRHHRVGETEQPSAYRVSDELVFSLDIEELVGGSWQPYGATDVQVEFVMLDPYVRANLSPNANGTFSTRIKVPDVYGVFKFQIVYSSAGYTSIELSEQVPVRPFRHNEYERFIVSAYPYYASVLSLMLAFLILDVLFLYQK